MTTLPASGSEGDLSFDRLNAHIQRWIREQGWQELRDVQDQAIRALLDLEADVLICASTAAGKTEAAFLPILTRVAERRDSGLSVLYISPLKALINDQFRRLDGLCERMEVNVVRWHGDAPQAAKQKVMKDPGGIALITPESIEALLLRRPVEARNMLGSLDFIVIDELHAFLQGPRGLHLASLLKRIDALSQRRARRVGLSATIGDPIVAARWMNPTAADEVRQVVSSVDAPELRLQIRGYVEPPEARQTNKDDVGEEEGEKTALAEIADHAFGVLRGSNNLFFGGSRKNVEAVADRLRRRAEKENVPNEFFPHHGSISKELREELELRLKDGSVPTTAVATTTLELGIDIGSVKTVAMLGAPRSLASLRQRLGRSGRRKGVPAILRMYVREAYPDTDNDLRDRLRLETVRAVAATRLLIDRFVEPPPPEASIFTVLLHQVLSLIVQIGGMRADALYDALCGPGPFASISKSDLATLLRAMASQENRLIEQAPNGLIMLAERGERLTDGRDFYAVFQSDAEWKVVADGRPLGSIPLSNAIGEGHLVIFAGRRWRVVSVDERGRVLEVTPHKSGRIPQFNSPSVEATHDRLAAEMREVLLGSEVPAYVDGVSASLLNEGRSAFEEFNLRSQSMLQQERDTYLLTWRGTAFNDALETLLVSAGLECESFDVGVMVAETAPAELSSMLSKIAELPTAENLSLFVENLRSAKYDDFIPDALLQKAWADRMRPACARLSQVRQLLVR